MIRKIVAIIKTPKKFPTGRYRNISSLFVFTENTVRQILPLKLFRPFPAFCHPPQAQKTHEAPADLQAGHNFEQGKKCYHAQKPLALSGQENPPQCLHLFFNSIHKFYHYQTYCTNMHINSIHYLLFQSVTDHGLELESSHTGSMFVCHLLTSLVISD